MGNINSLLLLVGRIAMSALFLWAVSTKIMTFGVTTKLMSYKLPFPSFFLLGAIFLQIVGGLFLITGFKCRLGAWMLILFTLPACILFHDYWNFHGHERAVEQIMFMKDIAIIGGLLGFAAFGPGDYKLGS